MKCDKCEVEFAPGKVKHAFYGVCYCFGCWIEELPNDCFHCGRVIRYGSSKRRVTARQRCICKAGGAS